MRALDNFTYWNKMGFEANYNVILMTQNENIFGHNLPNSSVSGTRLKHCEATPTLFRAEGAV